MSEDLCVTDQIALSRHRVFLLRELNRTRSIALRSAIYDQLAHLSALLCSACRYQPSIPLACPNSQLRTH